MFEPRPLTYFHRNFYSYPDYNKLAKLRDVIAISKSETITHSLTH